MEIALSGIDEERFGIRTARALGVDAESVGAAERYCRSHGAALLIARCPADDLRAVHTMERAGFRMMDTLVYYRRDLDDGRAFRTIRSVVRPVRPGEEADVAAVAAGAFRNYVGHYHADPRLERSKCDEAYVSWAVRACTVPTVASRVFVAEGSERISGFIAIKLDAGSSAECVLIAVAPETQGRGIGRDLMTAAMRWSIGQGARRMLVSTQIANLRSQAMWSRLGFVPASAYYTFHRWFD